MAEPKTADQLQAELDLANATNEKLQKDLNAEKIAHEKTISEASTLNGELQTKLQEKQAIDSKKPSVKIGGITYQVRYPAIKLADDKVVKAEDLIANTELCKELIEMGSKMLVPVKVKEKAKK